MNHAQDVLSAIRGHLDDDVPLYTDSLTGAFAASEPVFTRKRYADFFWHCASTVPGWLAQVMLANAIKESDGAAQLLLLWKVVHSYKDAEEQILAHAKDEARHSRLFVHLAQLAFPGMLHPYRMDEVRSSLTVIEEKDCQKADREIREDVLMDHLVQMNIGEIRTRIHMHLLAPVVHALAPEENKTAVRRILEGLAHDEVRHIAYTAKLMETWARNGASKAIEALYQHRLWDFNVITVQETESAIRTYGQGRFPDLLEI
jgi:hypothetical protein